MIVDGTSNQIPATFEYKNYKVSLIKVAKEWEAWQKVRPPIL
jgi:hypothetical protein